MQYKPGSNFDLIIASGFILLNNKVGKGIPVDRQPGKTTTMQATAISKAKKNLRAFLRAPTQTPIRSIPPFLKVLPLSYAINMKYTT
jgi:hypothetical protein